MKRRVRMYLHLADWQLWPWWSRTDPNRLFFGPLIITWYTEPS